MSHEQSSIPVYKVILIGDASVGKSSLIRRLLLDEFDEQYTATVGVDLSAVALNIEEVTPVILTAIDLGGQADFDELRSKYYQGAHFACLVYDISDQHTFDRLEHWYRGLIESVPSFESDSKLGMLLGNKSDLTNERKVSPIEGRRYASNISWPFYETSAKTGHNVSEVFTRIAKTLYTKFPPHEVSASHSDRPNIGV
ncbi:MAG: Rab family GTPase [Candidatus Thorarchaeota archaeon]